MATAVETELVASAFPLLLPLPVFPVRAPIPDPLPPNPVEDVVAKFEPPLKENGRTPKTINDDRTLVLCGQRAELARREAAGAEIGKNGGCGELRLGQRSERAWPLRQVLIADGEKLAAFE